MRLYPCLEIPCSESHVSNKKVHFALEDNIHTVIGLWIGGEWRRLHNAELNDLYSSPNIVRVIKSSRVRWAGHVERMGEERGVYRVLVGKPEGRKPLGRPRHR